MKILGLSYPDSGCGFHRVVLPLGFMPDVEAFVTNLPTEEKLQEGWDVLLYNRISVFDNDWPATKEVLNCKIVLDLDDYWVLPANHPNYHTYQQMAARIENNIRQADMVTVTNEQLAAKVRPYNDNVHIFPNALPYGEHQFTTDKVPAERTRIFWAGGSSHEPDIAILKNPIKRLQSHANNITMVMGGYVESETWRRMFSHFTAGLTLSNLPLPGLPPLNYMAMYAHADIMLVPLENTDWHGCKSNLKLLEAACKKVPVICSKVAPYSNDDAPVLWVEKQSDWYKHMNYLINNPEAAVELGQQLYEWATREYNFADINGRRKAAFKNLIGA
jgi:glycosyltransferase involved in cell wall biosynthesis